MEKPPRQDFVVRTWARREANGLPLMAAELVIAGAETRQAHPGAETYPLHFRKTYFPARLHGDPQVEFELHLLGVSALPDAAADRAHDHRVSQLSDPGPVLCAPHAVRRGAAREQHREGAEAAAGDGGGVVAARRRGARAAPPAPGRRPRARRHRAAQHHRLPRASGADPGRLRGGGPARRGSSPPPGTPAAREISSRSCARRSICNARSADSQASSASYRGAGSRRCFDLPIDFERAIEPAGRGLSSARWSSSRKVRRNTLETRARSRKPSPSGDRPQRTREQALQGPLRLFSSGMEERRTNERKHGAASSDHGGNQLQARGPAPRLQGEPGGVSVRHQRLRPDDDEGDAAEGGLQVAQEDDRDRRAARSARRRRRSPPR